MAKVLSDIKNKRWVGRCIVCDAVLTAKPSELQTAQPKEDKGSIPCLLGPCSACSNENKTVRYYPQKSELGKRLTKKKRR